MKKLIDHLKAEWYKYLLEILVLIIGIYGAFALENWNEDRKENIATRILAISLIEDLQKDVSFLERTLTWSHNKLKSCDSILTLCAEPKEKWNQEKFYSHMNWVSQSDPFFPTSGTYEQIVTSGTLKSFDQSIATQLNAYYTQLNKIVYWSNIEDESSWIMAEIIWKGMNVRAMGDLRFGEQLRNERYIRISQDETEPFLNLVAAVKTYRTKTKIECETQLELGKLLISSLKKKYNL